VRGYETRKEEILHRLARIEGQIRGIRRMIERDQPCVAILHQLAASRGALREVGAVLVEAHVRHCLAEAASDSEESRRAAASHLVEALTRFMSV
jgi:DNA-binding FrmR family transcriptional regulator